MALTAAASRFVGRTRELAQLGDLLAEARLVTLCGPPGIGKTRTALQYVARHAPAAKLCDLALVHDRSALVAALATQLAGATDGASLDAIAAAVGRCPLIVLDNAEQVIAPVSAWLQQWLALGTGPPIVVTSRERLRLHGERVLELAPLGLLRHDEQPSEAAMLFVDRLRDVSPDLQLDGEDWATIDAIVAQLDGIPLAIELAAARVAGLGLSGLLSRLPQQLSLLSRGERGAHARQATLRGAIEWSWRLLSPAEQRALALCALFRGPFEVGAAEAVIGEAALDRLQDLRDRSLLWSPRAGQFDLYAAIHAFAADALTQQPERDVCALAHARHYIEGAAGLARQFERQGAPLGPLLDLHDNLLQATQRALELGEIELAARGAEALGPVLRTRGPMQLHVDLLTGVLKQLDDDPALLHARGLARRGLGQLVEAESDLLAALEASDDDWLYAAARKDLGVLYHQQRAIDRARVCYEAALNHARKLDDRRMEATVVGNLGALEHDTGRFEQAARSYQQALELLRAVGDRRLEAIFITNLGVLEQEQGRRERAAACYRQALTLLEQVPDLRFEGIALGNLGVMEHEAGNVMAARELHETALSRLRQVGEHSSHALCLARLGAALAETGELVAADERLRAAETLVARAPLMLRVVRLYRCFLDLARGDEDQALARMGDAQQGRDRDEGRRLVDVSDDARVVLRMLGTRLAAGAAPHLEVPADGSWFCAPGSSRKPLDKYASAQRILQRLVTARLKQPGEAISADELFAVGWPGVQITAQSARNRLFVALAKLRKLGLKLLLLRSGDGYLLDPSTPLLRPTASVAPSDD